ncbi:putative phage related protein [Escherichia coli]|uniref:Putative phage related protein n=1 Tax=Escherichia coli TaxID=562 RepID=A0A377AJW1_ECOLX|nr:putative phage related protein [Escherichia coli]
MRYRREDADGDYTFGSGDDTWLINSPEAVAQAVKNAIRIVVWAMVSRHHRGDSVDPVRTR